MANRIRLTLSQKLAQYLLYTEVGVVFFLTLVLYGLGTLEPLWAFGGGAVFVLLLILAARLISRPWGMWLAWALQFVLVAAGFLNEMMFIVGLIFLAMWVYTMVKAKQIEQNAPQPEQE